MFNFSPSSVRGLTIVGIWNLSIWKIQILGREKSYRNLGFSERGRYVWALFWPANLFDKVFVLFFLYIKKRRRIIYFFINGTQKSPKLVLWFFHFVERMWNIISKLGGQAPKNNKNRDRDFWKKQKTWTAGALHQTLYFK